MKTLVRIANRLERGLLKRPEFREAAVLGGSVTCVYLVTCMALRLCGVA